MVRREAATTLRWGEDVVAVRGGRVVTWSSPEDCFAEGSGAGWSAADDEPTWMDLTPALEWHARQRRGLDAKVVLDFWNL
ncbi:MAG: hypothetical protein L6367_13420, partial [Cellulomonas sp.]|nr:hypothetical protein [Cellulomonas sp.]